MQPIVVISLFGILLLLLLIIAAPIKPIRMIGQAMVKIMVGALLLFFLNAFGTSINIHVPINFLTSLVSGFLGVPGIIALVIIQKFIIL